MSEAVNGLSSTLAVKNLKQLKWMGDSEKIVQAISNDQITAFVTMEPKSGKRDTVLTLKQISDILRSKGFNDIKSLPYMDWIHENACYFQQDSVIFFLEKKSDGFVFSDSIQLSSKAGNIFYDASKHKLAYTLDYNVFIRNQHELTPLTTDGSANLLYGTSVHRDEFGIDHGLFWSPKGNALAYYRMDQSMVADYPVINWSDIPATSKNIKYPMAGGTSHQVKLLVYHLTSKKTVMLQTGEPLDHYLTNITWSPDEKYVYIQELNREQNHMTLNQYDASTGMKVKTLLEEKSDKYVEPLNELFFLNEDEFIFWSQREGFMHLYKYSTDGVLQQQLTKGKWIVNEILGYNEKRKELIYTSTEESPMEKNIYVLNINSGKHEKLNETNATHTAFASKDGNYIIDQYTAGDIPRNIDLIEVSSGEATQIFSAKNPLENYRVARVELVELKADDGTPLYGKLIYPLDFDSTQNYPAIVYLYNGPHVQLVKNTFPYSGNLWYDYMAQHGYFVFVMDGRGSSNRGFSFESATHRKLGTVEIKDQLVGIHLLQSLPFIDKNRMGMHGWSFGGFMTTSFMLREPDVFKCAVAGGPVMDWSMYEIMYTERYMGNPKNNAEGYKTNLLLDKTNQLKGKLLLIHGTDDATVVWQHSIQFLKQAVTNNVQVDYFVYPGYEHNVRGKDRVHLMQKVSDYFDLYLKK